MIPSPRNATRSAFAMSATSGGLDSQPVAAPQRTGGLRRDLLAIDEIPPGGARLAACRALRPVAAALGDERVRHLVQGLEVAHDAVAAAMPAAASGPAPHGVLDGPQRELQLERLDRRVEGVAHRDVHGARAVCVLARALAAAESLVVGELLVAEREVVHRAL